MANPFYTETKTESYINNSSEIRNAYNVFKTSQNPMQTFMRMAQKNPSLQPIMQMLNRGVNPQKIFLDMCKERGINPQEFLNQFRQ